MTRLQPLVVVTGTANTASVFAALRRQGTRPQLTNDAAAITRASHVVLPGVGTFGSAMQRLRSADVADALKARVRAGRPTLAICLGLQLLAEGSEEDPGMDGLGVLPCRAHCLVNAPRVPHIGWNRVRPASNSVLIQPGYAYFANSYAIDDTPAGWGAALTEHGSEFIAALERESVIACQFHPELSGVWGADLISRWLSLEDKAC